MSADEIVVTIKLEGHEVLIKALDDHLATLKLYEAAVQEIKRLNKLLQEREK